MRPIDADKLKESLFPSDDEIIKGFCHTIDAQETLDVKPMVQGHWIEIKTKRGTVVALSCDICHCPPKHAIRSRYCPNCGAFMESEEK